MLETVRERISGFVDQGLSESEVVARKPLADLDPEWGDFFSALVYRDLVDWQLPERWL